MKKLLPLLLVVVQKFSFAQENDKQMPNINFPPLKKISLNIVDNQLQFNTSKWQKVDEQNWIHYFGVENKKFWTGQDVTDIRVLGSWSIGKSTLGYIYAVDIMQGDSTILPSVFITSYNTKLGQKGIDINPFKQVASPTGMKGKVTVTESVTISALGVCSATTTNKSKTKTLSKKLQFSINEDGTIQKL